MISLVNCCYWESEEEATCFGDDKTQSMGAMLSTHAEILMCLFTGKYLAIMLPTRWDVILTGFYQQLKSFWSCLLVQHEL